MSDSGSLTGREDVWTLERALNVARVNREHWPDGPVTPDGRVPGTGYWVSTILAAELARLEARLAEVERERNEWKETADSRYQTQTRYKLRTMKLANAVRLAHGWFLEEEYVAMADAMDDAMKPTNSVEPHD